MKAPTRILALALALTIAAPIAPLAKPTSDADVLRLALSRIEALEKQVAALQPQAPRPRTLTPSLAPLALIRPFLGAAGTPIFAYPGYGGGGGTTSFTGLSGAITSAQMIDPYVPVDAVMNVTGSVQTTVDFYAKADAAMLSVGATAASGVGAAIIRRDASTGGGTLQSTIAIVNLDPAATYPVKLSTDGSKVACSSTYAGALFFEAGGAGATDEIYICAKNAADGYAWILIADGEP